MKLLGKKLHQNIQLLPENHNKRSETFHFRGKYARNLITATIRKNILNVKENVVFLFFYFDLVYNVYEDILHSLGTILEEK